MMTLDDLKNYLSHLFPEDIVDYCPNGLQVEGKRRIASLATAVSASLETIHEAVKRGVDGLITHHGLFWQKDSYVITGTKRKKLKSLLENEISLFAYHLPLDLHQIVGNNWSAAREMGWVDLRPFGEFNGKPIGVQGKVPALPIDQFKQKLEAYYGHPATIAPGGKKTIQTVALVSGGAHKSLIEAARDGVDAFVTGSFDEPSWNEAFEEQINFFAMGHSATERVGPRTLASHIREKLGIPCDFIDISNPF